MTGLLAAYRNELKRIFAFKAVFATMIVSILIYSVFYPQPYLNEALREIPIALVDQDGTTTSREFGRLVDATPDVQIVAAVPDLPTAQRQVYERSISGILLIPRNFERDLLHGRASPVSLYSDASYFLINQRVSGAVGGVARSIGAEVESARLIGQGVDAVTANAVADPMPLTAIPLFNPEGGYATYLLPGAFVLLLQQTLLIAVCLLGTLPGRDVQVSSPDGVQTGGPVSTVLGKLLAYLTIEAVIVPFYLIALPYLYEVPRLGPVTAIAATAIPFVLSVSCLGLVLGGIFRTPLGVQLATAALGLPFFFLAGFSWPIEALPHGLRLAAMLVPSSFAIDGLVDVGQLGATIPDIRFQFLGLWALAFLYGFLAVVLEWRRQESFKARTAS